MKDYIQQNKEVINSWCVDGWEWSRPVSHDEYEKAKQGDFHIVLTPIKPIPAGWLKDIKGKKVLGLASGGGQQCPILCALGAIVTVIDFSEEQLKREKEVQQREGYQIEIIQGDISQPLPFEDDLFDFIIHPVSNVYIKDIQPVWQECYRVLKAGGTLMAGLDNGINYIVDSEEKEIIHSLPFDPLTNEEHYRECMAKNDGYQFSHTLEEQIGGQLRAGFKLIDMYEDTNGTGRLHELNIPSFWATLAMK